ncbi:MAG: cytochrome c [Pseudarcicella sp.]|nr:cytochrome c [Pseudarcicella sp.]MBP6410990.1 cytochrome c [Pseudarcicella sp.]
MLQKNILFIFFIFIYSCQSKESLKREQYIVEGMTQYELHCANCHQADGKGLEDLYPPLANSDFLKNNKKAVICTILNGMEGSLVVNGKTYHQPMPANQQLKPIDIAEIVTYIYNTWSDEKVITSTAYVQDVINNVCVKK